MMRCLVVLCLLAPLSVGQKPALDPWTVVSLRQVTEAIPLPEALGGGFVYGLSVPRGPEDPDGSARRELRHVAGPGETPRLLLGAAYSAREVRRHPSEPRLTVLARGPEEKVTRVWSFSPAENPAETLKALSPEGVSVSGYALSPSGGYLAYSTRARPTRGRTRDKDRGFDRIVYEEELLNTELWLLRLEDGATRRVEIEGTVHDFAWASDDETLVFAAAPTPLIDDRYMSRNLHAVHLPSNEIRVLADVPGKLGGFAISPEARRVAYVAGRDANDPKESSLYVVPLRGGWSTCLTPGDYEGHVNAIEWYDERTLLGLSVESCETRLWLQPVGGGEPVTVLPRGAAAVTGMTLDRESGRMALIADRSTHPREVHALDLSAHGAELRAAAHGEAASELPDEAHLREDLVRVTNSNPTLDDFALGRQEIFRYTARDGLEIEGLVLYPTDFDPKQRYPLICVIHGGPESQYLDGWVTRYATPGHMAAGRGYLQFYPNYRSSTGRGVAFSKAGQGDTAGKEFDDVLDGIDALVAKGWADPDRVGITGGSYGGYFTAWGATRHSERFRAGVMFVGISNQLSKIGTTDIPQESYLSHWKVRPWERPDLYLERSPIMYTEGARTALLILHGDADPRVSPTQSKELHRWLKLRGQAPVRLVLYPGEGHGNRRRASQLDYALRSLRWWDHFLKGDGDDLPPAGISYEAPR